MDLEILHNRCWIGNFFWALSSTPNPKTNFCQAQGLWNQILQFKGNFRLTRIQTFTRCRSTYPMISSPCPLTTYLSATLPLPLILPGTLTPHCPGQPVLIPHNIPWEYFTDKHHTTTLKHIQSGDILVNAVPVGGFVCVMPSTKPLLSALPKIILRFCLSISIRLYR